MPSVLSLEMNEVNFDQLQWYVQRGHLQNFATLLEECQLFETVSEKAYPELEPWIQWPTVYTGKTFAEHGIFRLGDVVKHDHQQIWEKLQAEGYSAGAISPMNAANRSDALDFFLPDPWTETRLDADPKTTEFYALVKELVNGNASEDRSTAALFQQLLPKVLPFIKLGSASRNLAILPVALRHRWARAGFLDSLLADLCLSLMQRHDTQYVSLFLNAAAHIQHHHMYDSAVYEGDRSNPEWYSSAAGGKADPLLFIYSLYDRILGQFRAVPGLRILISTGLSQVPNEREIYQYRVKDFAGFAQKLGIQDAAVEPRMSRDFLLSFASTQEAKAAKERLTGAQCNGEPLFTIEDRGETLFCQVTYFGPPAGLQRCVMGGNSIDLSDDLVLVSIENAIHRTTGYHIDTARKRGSEEAQIPLTHVHSRLVSAVREQCSVPLAEHIAA